MKKELSSKQRDELLAALKARFEKNLGRHPGLVWAKVQARLEANAEKLWSLAEMETTGGEPDVVGQDKKSGEFVFMAVSYTHLDVYKRQLSRLLSTKSYS